MSSLLPVMDLFQHAWCRGCTTQSKNRGECPLLFCLLVLSHLVSSRLVSSRLFFSVFLNSFRSLFCFVSFRFRCRFCSLNLLLFLLFLLHPRTSCLSSSLRKSVNGKHKPFVHENVTKNQIKASLRAWRVACLPTALTRFFFRVWSQVRLTIDRVVSAPAGVTNFSVEVTHARRRLYLITLRCERLSTLRCERFLNS